METKSASSSGRRRNKLLLGMNFGVAALLTGAIDLPVWM